MASSAVSFSAQISFDAGNALRLTRDSHFHLEPPPPDRNIWRRKPPDFRLQAFAPRPPKRNSRAANQPWRFSADSDARVTQWRQDKAERVPVPPKGALQTDYEAAMAGAEETAQLPPFRARFRAERPYTAKLKAARADQGHRERYSAPQETDFRQYPPPQSLGLPEFCTHKEPDPYNLRHLLQNRPLVTGPLHEVVNLREASGTMAGPVRQPEKWEQRLHLPQLSWPVRPLEFTRYRIPWRDPHDAFMESVEERLTRKWICEREAASS